MLTDLVRVLLPADGVAVLELNRPAKRNAFTQAMINDIVAALDDLDKKPDVRALVVTSGTGIPFCGESLAPMATRPLGERGPWLTTASWYGPR